MSDGPSTNSSRISPPKPEAGEPSSEGNGSRSPDEDTESDGLVTPSLVDGKTNITSSSEDCTRLTFKPAHGHERSTPAVQDNGSFKGATSGTREPGRRNASRRTLRGDPHPSLGSKGQCSGIGAARAGDEWRKKDRYQGRRSSEDAEKCSQSSSNGCVKDVEDQTIAREHGTKTSQHDRRRGAENRIDNGIGEQANDGEKKVSRTTGRKGTSGTDFERKECSMGEQDVRLNIMRTHEDDSDDDDDDGGSNGGDRERGKASIPRDVERFEPRGTQSARDDATSGAVEGQCGIDDGKKSIRRDHDCVALTPLRTCPSDNENVETIELDEKIPDCKGPIGKVQQGMDGPELENELTRSNQDEEGGLDEEAGSDLLVPPLEILDWEGPRQGQSATSRLHRHISGNDPEALGFVNITVPPPKEFLASRPLQSPARVRGQNEGKDTSGGENLEPESLHLESGLKPARKGRRASAADLEWSDGAEARDVSFSRHVVNYLYVDRSPW